MWGIVSQIYPHPANYVCRSHALGYRARCRSPEEEPEPSLEQTTQPDPSPTTEELVRRKVNQAFGAPGMNEVKVRTAKRNGCHQVVVRFYENTKDTIEANMHNVYQNVYGNQRLRNEICSVRITADGDVRVPGQRSHRERVYTTVLSGQKARSLDWQRSYNIDFRREWTGS